MIRYAFFLLAILGTAATAIAAVQPASLEAASPRGGQTVIEKNSPFPVLGAITVQTCAVEDCSDVSN